MQRPHVEHKIVLRLLHKRPPILPRGKSHIKRRYQFDESSTQIQQCQWSADTVIRTYRCQHQYLISPEDTYQEKTAQRPNDP